MADKEFSGVESEINDLFAESDETILDCLIHSFGGIDVIFLLSKKALYAMVNLKVVADKLLTA